MSDSNFRIDRGWTKLGYAIGSHHDSGSHIALFHDDNNVFTMGSLDHAIYKAIEDDFETTLGSFHGATYHFHGFMYDFRYSAAHHHDAEDPNGNIFDTSDENSLINCDWNQYLDHEGGCEECDQTCTSGCTNGDVCYECHPTCRTCTGHASHECVDCWCGAEVDSDGCCMCNTDEGWAEHGDKCQYSGCFSEGCDACNKGQCIHCEYGYDLHDGKCWACRENDCEDLDKMNLRECQEKGIRHDTGFCNCDSDNGSNDDNGCRICSMGCEYCVVDAENGLPYCEGCAEGYAWWFDMPHLCVFLQDDEGTLPMGSLLWQG